MLEYIVLKKKIPISQGQSVLDHSIQHKVPHLHECGGNGICSTCRIRVIDGMKNLTPLTQLERKMIHLRRWDPSVRLACQARLLGDPVSVERMIWTSAEVANLQMETLPVGSGEEREMCFLFCDIRNFTELASSQLNFDLAYVMNQFFTILGDPIFINNGIIYQYAGDEIIGLFGVSGTDAPEKICLDAIRAGLGMLAATEVLNRWELKEFNLDIHIGIGIHFGKAFIGNIGHDRHKQFAVIGDPMNVASRIQAKNKEMDTQLLISKELLDKEKSGNLILGKRSEVTLRGKEGFFEVFEILGFKEGEIIYLIQSSIKQILHHEDFFAELFYRKLFVRAPQVEKLFTSDMKIQGNMLTHMLRGLVNSLSRPNHLTLGLKKLGIQHLAYGVGPEHYPIVKEVLLDTISEILADSFTPELRMAWDQLLNDITFAMNPANS